MHQSPANRQFQATPSVTIAVSVRPFSTSGSPGRVLTRVQIEVIPLNSSVT